MTLLRPVLCRPLTCFTKMLLCIIVKGIANQDTLDGVSLIFKLHHNYSCTERHGSYVLVRYIFSIDIWWLASYMTKGTIIFSSLTASNCNQKRTFYSILTTKHLCSYRYHLTCSFHPMNHWVKYTLTILFISRDSTIQIFLFWPHCGPASSRFPLIIGSLLIPAPWQP